MIKAQKGEYFIFMWKAKASTYATNMGNKDNKINMTFREFQISWTSGKIRWYHSFEIK